MNRENESMKKIGLFFCSILVALCSVVVPRAGTNTVCAEAAILTHFEGQLENVSIH